MGLLGLTLLGIGAFLLKTGVLESTKIEIVEEQQETSERLVVEIVGEVQTPGVYELPFGSRVEDLLIRAGGFSASADRKWIELNLNRAAKLVDGQKIYIPEVGEAAEVGVGSVIGQTAGASTSLVNINTATKSQLDTLWGIGPARAQAIIDNRPYSSVEELLAKKIIPSNVFERIKNEITAP